MCLATNWTCGSQRDGLRLLPDIRAAEFRLLSGRRCMSLTTPMFGRIRMTQLQQARQAVRPQTDMEPTCHPPSALLILFSFLPPPTFAAGGPLPP